LGVSFRKTGKVKSPDFYIRCPENKKHIVGMDVILQREKA
jgi:hypothetical protein